MQLHRMSSRSRPSSMSTTVVSERSYASWSIGRARVLAFSSLMEPRCRAQNPELKPIDWRLHLTCWVQQRLPTARLLDRPLWRISWLSRLTLLRSMTMHGETSLGVGCMPCRLNSLGCQPLGRHGGPGCAPGVCASQGSLVQQGLSELIASWGLRRRS